MATIDAFGGRYIGNDFVAPQLKPRLRTAPVQRHRFLTASRQMPVRRVPQIQHEAAAVVDEQVYVEEQPAELFDAQMPAQEQEYVHTPVLTRRVVLVTLSVVIALGASLLVIPRISGIAHAASLDSSKLAAGIKNELHPASQSSFTMPAHSVLLKNDIVSQYVDSVEGQAITINIGTNSVIPLPTNIAGWIKTSAGPEKGTTVLSVNESAVSKYVTSAAQNVAAQPADSVSSFSVINDSSVVEQITNKLLKYNGITVSMPSPTSDSQTNQ